MGGYENQSMGTVQVDRQLPGSVLFEFMAPSRKILHYGQIGRRPQIIQAAAKPLCTFGAMHLDPNLLVVALLLKFAVVKTDIHSCIIWDVCIT